MKLNHLLPHAGVFLALALTSAASAQQQKQQPAKPKTTRPQTKKTVTQPAPASAGAVIVKDWESGPGATRAPQPGDFPAQPQLRRALTGSAGTTPTSDGGLEVIDPDNLQTSMVVTKATDGSLVYDCKQGGGDHAGHIHAQPQTPRVEVK